MATIDATIDVLTAAGFTVDTDAHEYFTAVADQLRMHRNGPYAVLHVLQRDDVTVLIEQNAADGISYPPVAVIESPRGRIAANPEDTELVLTLVGDLSA